jgi:three-Cys-motif partner protein
MVQKEMPLSTQGQGPGTPRKEEGLAVLFRDSLHISKAPNCLRFPYWHVDLHAGCGLNKKVCCDGSPLVFVKEACKAGRPVRAYFCDHNPEAIDELRGRLEALRWPEGSTWGCYPCDNADCLRLVTRDILQSGEVPGLVVGSVLADPNGYKGLPLDALVAFAATFPRIDLILNLNATVLRLIEGAQRSESPRVSKGFEGWPNLEAIVARLGRSDWWVRNLKRNGRGNGFTTLIGRNMETRKRPFHDFHHIRSTIGQEILKTLKRVLSGETPLPFDEEGP